MEKKKSDILKEMEKINDEIDEIQQTSLVEISRNPRYGQLIRRLNELLEKLEDMDNEQQPNDPKAA